MTRRPTGLLRRLPGHQLFASSRFVGMVTDGAASRRTLQRVLRIHDQGAKPSCVGQSHAAGIESVLGVPVSSVDIWTDARRRQGALDNPLAGTRSEFAILSLMRRGISPYVAGEDRRSVDDDIRLSGLDAELGADDRRQLGATHYGITPGYLDGLASALEQGMVVTLESGCKPAYFTAPFDVVLGTDYRSGDDDGHSERIYGRVPERKAWAVQGSWGESFGGWRDSDGTVHRGCVLVSDKVIEAAWNIDAIKIKA